MFIPHNVTRVFNITTVSTSQPHGFEYRCVIFVIKLAQSFFQMHGCLHRVVMWHVREQVMSNMCVADMMKDVIQNAIVSINRTQGSLKPVPLLSSVMRHSCVRVLQVGNKYQPKVHYEIRNDIDFRQPQNRINISQVTKETDPRHQCDVANYHVSVIFVAENWAVGVEVIRMRVIFTACDMEQKIRRPTEQGQFQQT